MAATPATTPAFTNALAVGQIVVVYCGYDGGVAPTLTVTAAKTDCLGFVYNATDTNWDMLAFIGNF